MPNLFPLSMSAPAKLPGLCAALLLGVLCNSTWALEVGPQTNGYRHDGSGIYPAFSPPTTNLKQKWMTELSSWGLSQPIVVGDLVIATVEPQEGERNFPSLVALDYKTGKKVWDVDLDHFDHLDDPKNVRSAFTTIMDDITLRFQLMAKKDDAEFLKEKGFVYNKRWKRVERVDEKHFKKEHGLLKNNGIQINSWRWGAAFGTTNCVGVAYATPVTDGRHIWTTTGWGGVFCHDLEGNEVWSSAHPTSGLRASAKVNASSPLLFGHLLISDLGKRLKAIDARDGSEVWSHDHEHDGIISPSIMTVENKPYLLSAGKVYSLPDGKPVEVQGWSITGMQSLVHHAQPDLVFFCGAGEHAGWPKKGKGEPPNPPAAVRFSAHADGLKADVLWHGSSCPAFAESGKSEVFFGRNRPWLTVFGNRLYMTAKLTDRPGIIIDAMTGTRLDGESPPGEYLRLIAADHIYALHQNGTLAVHNVNGQAAGSLTIEHPPGREKYVYRQGKKGGRPKLVGADAPTYTLGPDMIILRTHIHLVAIGQ